MAFSLSQQEFSFQQGGELRFETWFNLFNLDRWTESLIGEVFLCLTGHGRFEVTIHNSQRGRSKETLFQESLDIERVATLPLSDLLNLRSLKGVLTVSIKCLSCDGILRDMEWKTDQAPQTEVDAMIVIPTFEREDQIARLVAKLVVWRAQSPHALRVAVVDNGGNVSGLKQDGVTVITSENYGGSGGFAKGLMAAQEARVSHCVFMDDDADLHRESLFRSLAYLGYAAAPNTAICGAMIASENRRVIWENGATFYRFCHPHHGGTDLTSLDQAVEMEGSVSGHLARNLYAGWWFFAFPTEAVHHLPYPFFLRGDDVSFSLSNPFKIQRLNGVAAYQEGFTAKESPRSWYFDIRSHLVHHLSHAHLQMSVLSVLKIVVFFLGQTVLRMHYGSARAVLLGLKDVMRGPEFFAQNANMQARLSQIDQIGHAEAWRPYVSPQPTRRHRSRLGSFWILLGNGLWIPGFRLFGRHATINARDRRNLDLTWGASAVTVLHDTQPLAYHLKHSKLQAASIGLAFLVLALRFLIAYRGLRQRYQSSHSDLTSSSFWRRTFAREEVPA